MENAMRLLCTASLTVWLVAAMPTQAQQSTIPDFTSANFGWLVNTGEI